MIKTASDIRSSFPILRREVNGKPLVYFDNAASSQKPIQVINAIDNYYRNHHANIHRGVHALSQEATMMYEDARLAVAEFINAESASEIIFTRGATEGINLVAQTLGRQILNEGDEILVTFMEHHSNLVPWQMIAQEKGAVIKAVEVTEDGQLDQESFKNLLSKRTKIFAVGHVSNTLGTINPVKEMAHAAHQVGAYVVIDGAQSTPHLKVDVQNIDADFYAASGHKMYGPTGIGFLYGKKNLLNTIPPYHGGGEMISRVSIEKSTYAELPFKFEGGTPNMAGAIGLHAAIDFIRETDIQHISDVEERLENKLTNALKNIEGIRLIGTAPEKAGVVSFLVDGVSAYDVGVILDQLGIAVRTGHHCTEPLMDRYGIRGTIRASFAVYNTEEEVEIMVNALNRALKMLS
ncbi:MAG TPA: cysteine desulfurase CsdA [Flavobacteriales bacterium]|jgi:cysteine desulfurase/selenocysteine lyase|nr:cysteine desulfurase CsdA [Flavobacteriales bacterium]